MAHFQHDMQEPNQLGSNKLKQLQKRAANQKPTQNLWPDDASCLVLYNQLKAGNTRFNLNANGRAMQFVVAKVDGVRFYVKPLYELAPCGWFTLEWLRSNLISHGIFLGQEG